jgi:hypothetical protein
MDREGLVLTRCDMCSRRLFCAVSGLAMCRGCCAPAVEAAVAEARRLRIERDAQRVMASELMEGGLDIWLPPEA